MGSRPEEIRVFLVTNKHNREREIMERIKEQVLLLRPDARVEVRNTADPSLDRFVLMFRPHVILTYPLTVQGGSLRYYWFKLRLKSKIVCYRAEGIVNDAGKEAVHFHVGYDKYGKELVDHELFWGSKAVDLIAPVLVEQGKLSSLERARVVGYPRLEAYFSSACNDQVSVLPERVRDRLQYFSRDRVALFATGFHLANYTRENLFAARDLDAANRIGELLAEVQQAIDFRASWKEHILAAARANPEMLLVVKKHPIERRMDYAELAEQPNILDVYEDIGIELLAPRAGIFFHYGSTAVVDAYLARIPSVYVAPEHPSIWYSDMGWPCARRIIAAEIGETLAEFRAGRVSFKDLPEITRVLRENFNIGPGGAYDPSRLIAEALLENTPPQSLSVGDAYLWRSVFLTVERSCRAHVVSMAKRLLGIHPSDRLFAGLKARFSFRKESA